MAEIKEILATAMIPVIKRVGKLEMKEVLSTIKEHNTAEVYRNTLQGLYSNFSLLKFVTIKTKSRFDDGIVDLVLEAVKENADADGIVLG
ncbi:hypothetical protein [Lacibacter sp.]|uniref:hypothetical protein n=1 Tax=Lacibacter sp. TaxID=1915409 RepID=UPI002B4B4885|nr:hypothetical protein [Lacibacter sp.]HLP39472.1 hypothetical protein [Lacibacter sp.]